MIDVFLVLLEILCAEYFIAYYLFCMLHSFIPPSRRGWFFGTFWIKGGYKIFGIKRGERNVRNFKILREGAIWEMFFKQYWQNVKKFLSKFVFLCFNSKYVILLRQISFLPGCTVNHGSTITWKRKFVGGYS